ncbi:MAG: mechanosensitive ion channel [Cloacibacterium normanense]
MKVGDWIGIPKYNIEGNIQDINLLTTKIVNFDKTISTIPTSVCFLRKLEITK